MKKRWQKKSRVRLQLRLDEFPEILPQRNLFHPSDEPDDTEQNPTPTNTPTENKHPRQNTRQLRTEAIQ